MNPHRFVMPVRHSPVLPLAAFIAAYFFFFAGGGLWAGFTHDDLMNLHGAWRNPLSRHLEDLVLFFRPSPTFRPLGALFYRLLFELFGLNPLPFRAAVYVILLADLWLAYAVVRRMAHSRSIAAMAVLLWAYHGGLAPLYLNTGTVYDPLAAFFYLAAFLYYLRVRSETPPGWKQIAVWSGLYILSLNAKEMAASLPAAILAFELLSRPPRLRKIFPWILREGRVVLVGAGITLLFAFGRVMAPGGIAGLDHYHPILRLGVYMDCAFRLVRQALYEPRWLTLRLFYVGAALVLLAVAFSRSVPARFGMAWAAVAILPIAFIAPRGLDAALLPALGAALLLATAIVTAARALPGPEHLRFGGVFVAILAVLTAMHWRYGRVDFSTANPDSPRMLSVYRDLKRLRFPKDGRVLVLHDPFPHEDWASAFLFHLASNDRSMSINRLDRLYPAEVTYAEFDGVISWEGGRLVECDPEPFRKVLPANPPPAVCRIR